MNSTFFAWWPRAIVVLAAVQLLLSAIALGAVSDHPERIEDFTGAVSTLVK